MRDRGFPASSLAWTRTFAAGIVGLGLAVGATTAAQADVVLLDDRFLDSSLGNGNEAEIDTNWYAWNGSTGGTGWKPGGSGSAENPHHATWVDGSAVNTRMYGVMTERTLAQTGDWISVRVAGRLPTSADTATKRGTLSVALLDHEGAPLTADHFGPGTAPTVTHPNVQGSITGLDLKATGNYHVYDFYFERTADGKLMRRVTVDNIQVTETTIAAPTFKFNQIGFNWYGTTTPRISQIQVTVIPEPAAAGLLGAGCVALGLRRRR